MVLIVLCFSARAEQCKLYCAVKGLRQTNYYKVADEVVDGTRCTREGNNVCVNGVCEVTLFR